MDIHVTAKVMVGAIAWCIYTSYIILIKTHFICTFIKNKKKIEQVYCVLEIYMPLFGFPILKIIY